jgi:acetyl esterase/lipase
VLTPEIQAVLDEMNAAPGPPPHEIPVEQARINHREEAARLCGEGEPVAEVREFHVGEVLVRTFRPEGEGPFAVVVYLHGGGWIMGTLDSYDSLLRALANASGAIMAGVEYRLAPEHRYPAAVDDAIVAIRGIASIAGELGGDGARLALIGDSAGGNLAAVAARRLRGELPVALQVLVYPVIEAVFDTPSYDEFSDGHGLSRASMERFWRLYLDGADPEDPDAAPLRAGDLAGVAPAFVLTAEEDVLRDEGEAYAAALERAGVPTELIRWPGTIHGFFRWLAVTPAAREAIDAVGARLRQALAPE